ncbi:MAG: PepSY-associated TM helix domain-containing protein [Acidimicrobiales bacterium]
MPTSTLSRPDTGADHVVHHRPRSAIGQKWTRLIHVYLSMAALLVVLFFGVTGVTLNHPDWTLGFPATTIADDGDLPASAIGSDGTVELLALSEYLRAEAGVRGEVSDFGSTDTGGYLSYRGPGYAADVQFDIGAGTYTISGEQQGFVGVMNDLHKGRDTNTGWGWLIDVAGGFLILISLSGLGLQLFLRRRRTSAVVTAAAGGIMVAIVAVLTLA